MRGRVAPSRPTDGQPEARTAREFESSPGGHFMSWIIAFLLGWFSAPRFTIAPGSIQVAVEQIPPSEPLIQLTVALVVLVVLLMGIFLGMIFRSMS